jgi:hypothetical protein
MLLSEIWGLFSVGRPLWLEDVTSICSVIIQWSESLRTRNHTLLSHLRLPQPGVPGSRIYIPQEQGGPVIPEGTGFPLRRLLRLAGLRWRYSNPPPTWGGQVPVYISFRNRMVQSKVKSNAKAKSQSHITTDSQSISTSWCLVHSELEGSIRMNFNPTSGLIHYCEIFYVTIGRAACEACSATWNLGTNSAFALWPRKTTEKLDRVGWSQDLPDANWLLASSQALNTRVLFLVPIFVVFSFFLSFFFENI